jgi:hypothetical protein
MLVLLLSPKREAQYGDVFGDLPGMRAVSLSVCRPTSAKEPHLLLPLNLVHFGPFTHSIPGHSPFRRLVIAFPVLDHCHDYHDPFARSLHTSGSYHTEALDTYRTGLTGLPAFTYRTLDK